MSGVKWSSKDLKDKGIAQVNGIYQKLTVKKEKEKKLPNLLDKALQQAEPGNKVIGECGAKIYIKPLSVNAAYKGRRFKTKEYDKYCDAVSLLLPSDIVVPDGYLKVEYEFGLSSNGGDFDNPVKPLQDILSKKYGFNDNKIMIATIKKIIVPKGKEYIRFRIEKF